jgi:hypothetical protein
VIFGANGRANLVESLRAYGGPCADYYITIPPNAKFDRTPKPPEALRSAGSPAFHAVAEFRWSLWAKRRGSWRSKGIAFRKEMQAHGFDVAAGDTWAVNELPRTTRRSAETRKAVRSLVGGLHDGPAGSPKVKGITFLVDPNQDKTRAQALTYRDGLKGLLLDRAFWSDMARYVRFWSQETYVNCRKVCVRNTTVAAKASRVSAFTDHLARLAFAGPREAAPARGYLDGHYVPLLTAYWKGPNYGQTDLLDLDRMMKLVSLETYAVRSSVAAGARYLDNRIGFAWNELLPNPKTPPERSATAEEWKALARRLAEATGGAYGAGGKPAHACSPSGAFTWCNPGLPGASFTDAWSVFASW